MRALVTGITGFAGSHLADYLLSQGVEVWGTIRWRSLSANLAHLTGKLHLVECDLRDSTSVGSLLEQVRPDRIFHLAAQTFVPTSFHAPAETFIANTVSQINLLEAVLRVCPEARTLVSGSSEEYGRVLPEELPVKETNPLRPLSPYAVSKAAQDLLAYQYHQSHGLYIVRTRAFNHEGPRRAEVFALSSFAKQIAEMESGLREPVLLVGNLDSKRDFLDVRDVVRGYWLALELGEPGEVFNIASGHMWRIGDALDHLLALSKVRVEVRQDPARLRPSDVLLMLGDATNFRARTGWTPEIPFEQTLRDLLDDWRAHIGSQAKTSG